MANRSDFPYHNLSIEEQLLLVEEIWDSIAADRETARLADARRTAIRRRLAEHRAHPKQAVGWEGDKTRVQAWLDAMRAQ